jgi:hypothetical protein
MTPPSGVGFDIFFAAARVTAASGRLDAAA